MDDFLSGQVIFFVKLFYGVICTLEHNPMAGSVSPALVGTSGIIPLTIITTIADIMLHYYHAITHAEKEVLFATCWWEKGEIADMMCKSLRDLSKRAAEKKTCRSEDCTSKFEPDLVCLHDETRANQEFRFGIDSSSIVSTKDPLQKAVARTRLRFRHDRNKFSTPTRNRKSLSKSPLTTHLNECGKCAQSVHSAANLSSLQLERQNMNFTSFIFHSLHQPVPIAFVNCSPNGIPGHVNKVNPQNLAWIYTFRCAQKSIFIQSPNFNASLVINGVMSACRRGVQVTLERSNTSFAFCTKETKLSR
ncbi:unnamed protein product [Adineta ricciae]|uniref:Uncharacterized protein n=1 Tax=Adineta ricciae TaxID=249248 RepID=A0A815U9V4_ADIRI|nr:unnamed protein product [Adineta ricciae]